MRLSRECIVMHSTAGMRKNNEDFCGFHIAEDQSASIIVLADGMGGHSSGEVASQRAVNTILRAFQNQGFSDPERLLEEAILTAHEKIYAEASGDKSMEGMGTTIVAGVLKDGTITVGHVGDSRAFQFRAPYVRRLTEDHLYITEVLGLDEHAAKQHPRGNMLGQAVGSEGQIRPTINRFAIEPGDQIILCTDGVSDCVPEPDMLRLLGGNSLTESTANIVDLSIQNGSRDNCSVVAVRVPK